MPHLFSVSPAARRLFPLVVAGALLSLLGCDRTAEPAPQVQSAARSAEPNAASEASTPDGWTGLPAAPACTQPLAPEAPPLPAPASHCPTSPAPIPAMPHGSVRFTDAPSAPVLDVELARTPEHRAHGLMYRAQLGEAQGMLFTWADAEIRRFWMRNTCLPLDMLFLDASGAIVGIVESAAPMTDDSRSVPCAAAHVLEVNAGFSRRHGVKPGQRLQIDASGAR